LSENRACLPPRANVTAWLQADAEHLASLFGDLHVRFVPIVLQKSFCITEHNFSGPQAQRLNNHAGGYVNWR